MYGLTAFTIVGYTYQADLFCLDCMRDTAVTLNRADGRLVPSLSAEVEVDVWAAREGIDRDDENTFDSDDFPKVIFAGQVTWDDSCGCCNTALLEH